MNKRQVTDLSVSQKAVLLRLDLNVPIDNGVVRDATRLEAALPTLKYLIEQQAKVIVMSHLGRPEGKPDPKFSLAPVAEALAEMLGQPVQFSPHIIGSEAKQTADALTEGQVLVLENLRFHPGEMSNDPAFAEALATLGEHYVCDAFGTIHRAHASVAALPQRFPEAAAGLLLMKEIEFLHTVFSNKRKKPMVAVIGGAKVSDKLGLLKNLLQRMDTLLIGGAMAYTFLKARNYQIGASRYEADCIEQATYLINEAPKLGKSVVLPIDHIVAQTPTDAPSQSGLNIPEGQMGFDIGPITTMAYANSIKKAKLVLWNGPLGMYENPNFCQGTHGVAEGMAHTAATTIVCGGDSIAALNSLKLSDSITHISTGGGAALAFLENPELPGLTALADA